MTATHVETQPPRRDTAYTAARRVACVAPHPAVHRVLPAYVADRHAPSRPLRDGRAGRLCVVRECEASRHEAGDAIDVDDSCARVALGGLDRRRLFRCGGRANRLAGLVVAEGGGGFGGGHTHIMSRYVRQVKGKS